MDEVQRIDTKESLEIKINEAPDLLKEEIVNPKYSVMPEKNARYLKPVTATGHRVAENYKSYSVTQLKDALDHGDYTVVGRTFRGKRTRLTKKKEDNKHSEFMNPLIESIDILEETLKQVITPENVEQQIEQLLDIYNAIFKWAYRYCVKQDPWFPEGKARKDMVMLIRDQANEERLKLTNNARILADKVRNDPDQTITFEKAIGMVRSQSIREGENGIKTISAGGKGTSDIIVAEKEDGSKLYIRPSESIKKDSAPSKSYFDDTMKATLNEMTAQKNRLKKKNLPPEEMQEVQKELIRLDDNYRVQEMFSRSLSDVPRNIEPRAEIAVRKLTFARPSDIDEKIEEFFTKNKDMGPYCAEINAYLEKLQKDPEYMKFRGRRSELNLAWKAANTALKTNYSKEKDEEKKRLEKEYEELKKEFDAKDTVMSRFLNAVQLTGKHVNQRNFARKVAKVKEGSNISNRNVAVSIMARTLGLRDLVAESSMVEVNVGGKTISGTVMEEAKGEDLSKVVRRNEQEGRRTRYSPEAMRQISCLHIFDILMGQIDRKPDNYMSVIERQEDGTDMVMSIKAIDNDMSCGMIDYDEDVFQHSAKRGNQFVQGFRQQLPAISDYDDTLLIEAVDKDLRDRILALPPEFIDFQLAGIISSAERRAMKERLNALKRIFRKNDEADLRRGKPSIYKRSRKDWERYRDHFEQHGADIHTYYLGDLVQKKEIIKE